MTRRRWTATVGLIVTVGLSACGRSAAPAPTPSSRLAVISHTPAISRTPATTTAAVAAPTPVSPRAHAAGLHDVRTVVPDAIIGLRYATRHNFTGVRLYPTDARCLVHKSMAAGLKTAAARLRHAGYRLVFWDCYRPHAVQVHMFRVVPNPDWVARPGPYARSHESGRSVDVTLARASTAGDCTRRVEGHCLLAMGTGFDDFSPRAYAFATEGVGAHAQSNRTRLRTAMNAGGLTVYTGEWWHFDGPGADIERPVLHAPLH